MQKEIDRSQDTDLKIPKSDVCEKNSINEIPEEFFEERKATNLEPEKVEIKQKKTTLEEDIEKERLKNTKKKVVNPPKKRKYYRFGYDV